MCGMLAPTRPPREVEVLCADVVIEGRMADLGHQPIWTAKSHKEQQQQVRRLPWYWWCVACGRRWTRGTILARGHEREGLALRTDREDGL